MTADGWVILGVLAVAVAYSFGVKVPQPARIRARRERADH